MMHTARIDSKEMWVVFVNSNRGSYEVLDVTPPTEYPAIVVYSIEMRPYGKDICDWVFVYESDFEDTPDGE